MADDLDFVQTRWATIGASNGDRYVRRALGPFEMKGDLCVKGLEPLGELGDRMENYGIQKGTAT